MLLQEPPRRPSSPSPSTDFDPFAASNLHALHAVACGILASEDLAWDAVQEALLCLWNESTPPHDARAWLVRTVVHKSMHVARSHRRAALHEERACRDRPETCPLCDPLAEIEDREIAVRLERVLRALPEDLRAVFMLRQQYGLDYREIAGVLSVPIGTVRSRLNRVRAHLAARLEIAMPEEG